MEMRVEGRMKRRSSKGAFTPAEHCLRTFENVFKRSRTFANMHEGIFSL